MHILLTGFMGVGKTTIGKKLSRLLSLDFVDLDQRIEQYTAMSISTIFDTQGEAEYRRIESEVLQNVLSYKNQTIIALGGGTICYNQNHTAILNHISVYLYKPWDQTKIDILKLKNRPIIESSNMEDLMQLFIKREPFYSLSQLKTPVNSGFNVRKLANRLKLLTNR